MNPENKKIGNDGELHASMWLAENGHTILNRNFRKRIFEIDLVTLCPKGIVHLVEVKTVDTGSVDDAVFSVHSRNVHRYFKGADAFIEDYPEYSNYPLCMDVVIVTKQGFLYYENVTQDIIL